MQCTSRLRDFSPIQATLYAMPVGRLMLLRDVAEGEVVLLEGPGEPKLIDSPENTSRNSYANSFAELGYEELLSLKVRLKRMVGLVVRVAYAMTILVSNS